MRSGSRSSKSPAPATPAAARAFIARCRSDKTAARSPSNSATSACSIRRRRTATKSDPRRLFLVERRDLAQLAFDLPASVILLQAAGLAGVFRDDVGLEVAADLFAAFQAQPRVGQHVQSAGRDGFTASLAVSFIVHRKLPSAKGGFPNS